MTDPIRSHTLRDGDTEITVLSMGCAIQDWRVAGRPVVLGYQNPEDYRTNPKSMGIVVGRVANRISGSQFELGGQIWQLPHRPGQVHIHGGPGGIGWQNWHLEPQGPCAVTLRLRSPHLDQGYPGAVEFEVSLSLKGAALTWDMRATPDRLTPINLAQHVYFNLNGAGTIRDHTFQLNAAHYTPNDHALIPTGEILPVESTRFDLRRPQRLDQVDPQKQGYDLNFALADGCETKACVRAVDGTLLRLWTDRPDLQLYTSNSLSAFGTPLPGGIHGPFGGFCLEAQDFPNALNTDGFGDILYAPDGPYHQTTTIEITRG